MNWQSIMRWKKCIDTIPLSRFASNSCSRKRAAIPSSTYARHALLNNFSSDSNSKSSGRKSRKHQQHSQRVPDYLIPLAYRHDGGGQNNTGGGGTNSHRRGGGPSSRGRSNSNSNSNNAASRNRRRSMGKHQRRRSSPSNSNKAHHTRKGSDGGAPPDIDSVRNTEEELSLKKSEYMSLVGKLSSAGAVQSSSSDIMTNNNFGPLDQQDKPTKFQLPEESDIRATEELYEKIASDFKTLIIGWSEIAESICASKRTEHSSSSSDVPSESDHEGESDVDDDESSSSTTKSAQSLMSDYEDAVLKAERHLESFEDLYRNHRSVVSNLDEVSKKHQESVDSTNATVMGKISSIVGDFFSNDSSSSSFDDSWNTADGRPSTKKKAEIKDGEAIMNIPVLDLGQQVSLYEHVLLANHSSYCFGKEVKEKSTTRSNRLLNRWISQYCESAESDKRKATAEEDVGERRLFHAVIRQNGDLVTMDGLQRGEDWLKRMQSLHSTGIVTCGPDIETYNLVLLGYCNLCKLFHRGDENDISDIDETKTRQFILDGAERLMLELANNLTNQEDDDAAVVVGPRPNTTSLNLALSAMAKAGNTFPHKTCQKTNSLVFKIFGEELYREMCVGIEPPSNLLEALSSVDGSPAKSDTKKGYRALIESGSASSKLEPNLDTYHWLVDIYSSSRETAHIKQAVHLLKRMVKIRMEQEPNTALASENRSSRTTPASFAPSTGTHNKVLKALVDRVDDLSDLSNGSDKHKDIIAKELMDILNAMVQYESSFPNHISYLSMLNLWRKTVSPDAGEYAEEILSRAEIAGLYQDDMKPPIKASNIALDCWLTAAKAGKTNAAERAFRLLKTMEVQAGRDRSDPIFASEYLSESPSEASAVFDRSVHPQSRMYYTMLQICAATHVKEDLSRAMAIAFEVYDKIMVDEDIDPNPKIFELMYACVKNYLDEYPDEQRQGLLQKVFELAAKHDITRGELIGRHKELVRRGNLAA